MSSMRRRKKVDYCFVPVVALLSLVVANKNVALLFVGATIEISCSLNPSLSGVYVRGVLPGHEDAFVKAAAATAAAAAPNDDDSNDDESSLLWLYRKDRGVDGFRWFIGNDVASDSALAFFDTWSMLPCSKRLAPSSVGQGSWMVTSRNGEWVADPAFTIRCNGLDPGGVDACSSGQRHNRELLVPCVNLTGSGASPVPMPVVMLGTAYLSASHGAGAAHPEAIERAPAIDVALDDDDNKDGNSRPGYSGLDLGSQLHPAYANERLVGSLLAARPGRRRSLFLTTKLAPNEHGYNSTLRAFQRSLRLLRTDTIDLYLIHHPHCRMAETCEGDWAQSWRALERLLAMGAARAIGVSNFDYELLAHLVGEETSEKDEGGRDDERWKGIARAPVSLIQNRADPLAPEDPRLLVLCQKHAIQYQAYSALGRQWVVGPWSKYWKRDHPILTHPDVVAIADRISNEIIIQQHHSELAEQEQHKQQPPVVGPAQVILRWALQKGWAVVPKTSRADRLQTNRELFHFELTERDMHAIDHLEAPPLEEMQRFEEL